MSETSLHCVSDIASFWNKSELHLFNHQRFNYCCAEKYTCSVRKRPFTIFHKISGKTGILLSCYIVYNEFIEKY